MATRTCFWLRRLLLALGLGLVAATAWGATITIVNLDGAGEGFNDPTPVAPVGGNTGTTIGAQRLIVFQTAASIWGGILPSDVTIVVGANFDPLTCTSTSGVLGSAGAATVFRDFPNAPFAQTWYCSALADKFVGVDLNPGAQDINARFNSNVGTTGCLDTSPWYYGLDHNHGAGIDLLVVLLHELAHGLGFQTFANLTTGALLQGLPDVYSLYMLDQTAGLYWPQMNNAQRVSSAVNTFKVLWDGGATKFMAPRTLDPRPVLKVNSPLAIIMNVGTASFGPPLSYPGVTGDVVLADDGTAPTSDACTALINGAQIAGKIALVDRGACNFTVKVKNAQNAGAIGVIVADNVAGSSPSGMSGTDPTITIPSVRITLADGDTLKAHLGEGVNATLQVDPTLYAGADAQGRMMLYAPNPPQLGSSISHWDPMASPNLLMEPAINNDLTSSVDLTRFLFEDIGWVPRTTDTRTRTEVPVATLLRANSPNPFAHSTAIHFALPREGEADLGVYDLSGRLVKHLLHASLPAGEHVTVWDGTDTAGRRVPGGVYFSHLRLGNEVRSQRMVMVQ